MTRNLQRVCRHQPAVKPSKSVQGGVDPIVRPPAEQAKKEFTENWPNGGGASHAGRPQCRHMGAVSAIAGAAFDAATTPRNHLYVQALALPMRVPPANCGSPANCSWSASSDHWKRFWRSCSERGTSSSPRSDLCRIENCAGIATDLRVELAVL